MNNNITPKPFDQNDNNENTPNFDFRALNEELINSNDSTESFHREGVITGEQILKMPNQEMPTLIEPILQKTGIACLAGSSDTGKSTLLRQLVIAIVTGEIEFLGFPINAVYRSAIYVSTEDLLNETQYLLRVQSQQHAPELLKGLRYIFGNEVELKDKLNDELTLKPADIVVIDCFSDGFPHNLKDTHLIRAYLNQFQDLAQKHKCLILFLHHTGKRTQKLEPSKDNLLSGQGFEAKMRMVIELRADPMSPTIRHLCIVKGNYLSAKYKNESFVLCFDEKNFHFTNTGERVPFELLVKSTDTDQAKENWRLAKELEDEGHTQEEIAKKMNYASKGTISKLLKKGKDKGWGDEMFPKGNAGNIMETDAE
jgi:archaellum biogenesis ATPase FlaH